jgi:hypothetical protein
MQCLVTGVASFQAMDGPESVFQMPATDQAITAKDNHRRLRNESA